MSIRQRLYRRVSHPLKIPEERRFLSPIFFLSGGDDENFIETTGFQYNQDFQSNRNEDNEFPIICTETRDYDPNDTSFLSRGSIGDNFLQIREAREHIIRLKDGTIIRVRRAENSDHIVRVFNRNGVQVRNVNLGQGHYSIRQDENGNVIFDPIQIANGDNIEDFEEDDFNFDPKWLTGEVAVPFKFKDDLEDLHSIIESLTSIRYEEKKEEEIKKPPMIIEDNVTDGTATPSDIENKNTIISISDGNVKRSEESDKPQQVVAAIAGILFYIEDGKVICYSEIPEVKFTYQDYLREFPPYHLAAYGYTRVQKGGVLRLLGRFDLYTHLIGSINPYYQESGLADSEKSGVLDKLKTSETLKEVEQKDKCRKSHGIFKNLLNLIDPDTGSINNFAKKAFVSDISWEDLEYPEGLGFISTIRSAEQLKTLTQLLNQMPFGKTPRGTEKKKFSLKGKIPFVSVKDHLIHIQLARRSKRWQGGFYDPTKRTLTISMEVIYFALIKEYPELKDRIGIQSNFHLDTSFDCLPLEQETHFILQTLYQFNDKTTNILSPLIEFGQTGLCLFPNMWTFPVSTSLKQNWEVYFNSQLTEEEKMKGKNPLKSKVIEEYADRYICLFLKDDNSLEVDQISANFQVDLTMIFPSPRLLEALYDLGQKIEVERQHGIVQLNLMQIGEYGKREIFKSLFYKPN